MLLTPRGIQLFIGTSPTLLTKLTQSYFSPSYHSQEGLQFLLYVVAQVWLGRIKNESYVWPQTISNVQKRPRINFLGLRKTKSKVRACAPWGNFISEQFYLVSWEGQAELPAPAPLPKEPWEHLTALRPSQVVCDKGLWTSWGVQADLETIPGRGQWRYLGAATLTSRLPQIATAARHRTRCLKNGKARTEEHNMVFVQDRNQINVEEFRTNFYSASFQTFCELFPS